MRRTFGLLGCGMKALAVGVVFAMAAAGCSSIPSLEERAGNLYISHVHRGGGKKESPDNTLATFKWCWENGSAPDYPSVMFKVIKTLREQYGVK